MRPSPVPVLLVSPREPSGASWIINCLLELGIRVCLKSAVDRAWGSAPEPPPPSAMWCEEPSGRWRLHPRADALKKWLPALTRHDTLKFRDDLDVLYVQELPRAELRGDRTVLFVRDLRDSLNSLHKRDRPQMPLASFVGMAHPRTLLDAIGHWRLFVESWLGRHDVLTYRFEDYKADAVTLLGRILHDVKIDAAPGEIERAARLSSFEQAAAAEATYKQTHPGDDQVAIRAGRVGEWQAAPEVQATVSEIQHRAGDLLARLGYEVPPPRSREGPPEGICNLHFLSFFDDIELPATLREAARTIDPLACPNLPRVLQFASSVEVAQLKASRLDADEVRTLLDSLDEFVTKHRDHLAAGLRTIRSAFAAGSAYHLDRIRALHASRPRRGPG